MPQIKNQVILNHIETESGYTVEFNSPIVFDVEKHWDENNQMTWRLASVGGFGDYSKVLSETDGDLYEYAIPTFVLGVLSDPPCPGHDDQEYELFYNYLRNSVESVTWQPPEGFKLVGTVGPIKLDFAA